MHPIQENLICSVFSSFILQNEKYTQRKYIYIKMSNTNIFFLILINAVLHKAQLQRKLLPFSKQTSQSIHATLMGL